jgi:hypothetical protein
MGIPIKSGYYGYRNGVVYVSVEEALVYFHGEDTPMPIEYCDISLFGDRIEVNLGKVTVVTEE